MFVQVINGQGRGRWGSTENGRGWISELEPDASGWPGTTAGVTADGEFVVPAPFASAEGAARRYSERPGPLFVEQPSSAD